MLKRVIQFGLATILSTAIAGFGIAQAQDDDEFPAEGEAEEAAAEAEEGMEEAAAEGEEMATEGGGAHGLTLPKGGLAVFVNLGVGMSKENAGDPISLSPDIWYGVSDQLSVGLTHSIYGLTGFWSGALLGILGPSLCLSGDGCGDAYDVGAVQAKFGLKQDASMAFAAVGGLAYGISDPFTLSLRAGVEGVWRSGKIGVHFTPSIYIGLNERDAGNKESLHVPVSVMFAANPQLQVGVQTGIQGPLDGFGDSYSIPLGLGAIYMVNPNIMAGGAFMLERVAGFEGVDAADLRSLSVFVGWMK
jgi:opacity protein-like surface antigen